MPAPGHRQRQRQHWHRRWPDRAPAAAAAWGVLYAVVQAGWAATRTGVPWKAHSTYPPVAHLALAARTRPACATAPEPPA
ncbi:hypothetical protein [Kitasatospora phosalacinea]|uniref:hypothetical protein n=1 Tax=Kitasatospora phosalacinea TaxID=2065 RepID=UPI0005270941|nr:hypothetical protein [Kitasatospora phosalacinea]